MKKKVYIKPSAEVIEIDAVQMLAASIGVGEGEVDAGEAWSNRRRGTWGNLWADNEKE